MEPIDVGIYSLLPPLIAITLALITKEVILPSCWGSFPAA